MKVKELRNQTLDELNVKEQELRKELFNLRFQSATGEIQNPRRIRQIKKDVARVLTLKTEMAPKNNPQNNQKSNPENSRGVRKVDA
ncbi:50S ribosomal protein L29 [Candidatus Magnetominusculus xianensis]|uniref:Large ribosomal subunit protein uL29 n=1 Tax=Candidatus Magnetominusculus xianensis TaxID=1748249 RepID=A0ABR5SDK2_9BACT|nr:50S ribosomal protein L29 [Candidatus Magnetominusculus xianensis]KWT83402.1 50S ribosomal protein L29 [Candidatus Magnetominusculus xianensis]MBF0403512.1 50S ribosomal protein L29 [Nitrospirota bacterium]